MYLARYGVRAEMLVENEGPFDMVLTREGEEQAGALADFLSTTPHPPTQVLASPFQRAVITGSLVAAALDIPLKIEDGLTEWLTPSLVGGPGSRAPGPHTPLTPAQHAEEGRPNIDTEYASVSAASFPEDEDSLKARCAATLSDLFQAGVISPGSSTLIVSHAPVLLALALALTPALSPPPWPLGGVSSFDTQNDILNLAEGVWQSDLVVSTSHLSGPASNGIQSWTLPSLQ